MLQLIAEFDLDGNGTLEKEEIKEILMTRRNLHIHRKDLDREFEVHHGYHCYVSQHVRSDHPNALPAWGAHCPLHS